MSKKTMLQSSRKESREEWIRSSGEEGRAARGREAVGEDGDGPASRF